MPKEMILRIRRVMLEEFEEREDQNYLISLEDADAAQTSSHGDAVAEDIAESYAEDTPEVYEQEETEQVEEESSDASAEQGEE
jgi:hypothetical protein